jgi:ABC-type multidrug transport system ATPase subunit
VRRYVEQFDTLIGQLTVQEMLLYTAELKRSKDEPLSEKRMAVDQVGRAWGGRVERDSRRSPVHCGERERDREREEKRANEHKKTNSELRR